MSDVVVIVIVTAMTGRDDMVEIAVLAMIMAMRR